MRVTVLETLQPSRQPNVLFVRLTDDSGRTGLGEAFFGANAVAEYLHTSVAPVLFGLDDVSPEVVAKALAPYCGYQGSGVELRGNGAVDLALWDLAAKAAGLPLARLLGGPVRDKVRIYNTCAGTRYVSLTTRQQSSNWGLPEGADVPPYEDLYAFLHHPRRLTRELLDEGISAMKVWPFDLAAEASGGNDIAGPDLAAGLSVVDAIRQEAGDAMDILVELHGLWSPRAAQRICESLEPYRPYWVEDPLRPDMVDAMAGLRQRVSVPIASGETVAGQRAFLQLLSRSALDVVTVDIGWTGGLTEARKVASLAEAFGVPVAPHDCTGPVSLAVGAALVLSAPNGLVQETARAFIRTWYGEFVTGLPEISGGVLTLAGLPGHGVELVSGLTAQPGLAYRRSQAQH